MIGANKENVPPSENKVSEILKKKESSTFFVWNGSPDFGAAGAPEAPGAPGAPEGPQGALGAPGLNTVFFTFALSSCARCNLI